MADLLTLESFFQNTVLNPRTLHGAVLYAVVLLTVAVVSARALQNGIDRLRAHADARTGHHADHAFLSFAGRVGRVVVYLAAFILYAHIVPELNKVGTALLAGASVASVVIGLAAQSTLGNLVAGFALLLYRPFHTGDWLRIDTPDGVLTAVVADLTLGHTVLTTSDGHRVVIPNSELNSRVLINLSDQGEPAGDGLAAPVEGRTEVAVIDTSVLPAAP